MKNSTKGISPSFSIRLEEDTRKALDIIAEEQDRSVAYIIKAAIKQYLKEEYTEYYTQE